MNDILNQISPGLTFYAIMVTMGVICFKLSGYFKDREEKVYNEYFNLVTEIKNNFRALYIEPIIINKIESAIKSAISQSFLMIRNLYFADNEDYDFANEKITLESLTKTEEKAKQEIKTGATFFSTASGINFFQELDNKLLKTLSITYCYNKTKFWIKFTYISLFILGCSCFFALFGLLIKIFLNTYPFQQSTIL